MKDMPTNSSGKPPTVLCQSDFSDISLPALNPVPGMISASEQRFLFHMTRDCCADRGAVVEVGTWLGKSTTALAAGLSARNARQKLHCYDRYCWKAFHSEIADLDLRPGDDFQPAFERFLAPYRDRMRVTKTDLSEIVWKGGPIELLVLDAPKKASTLRNTLEIFGPALIPGISKIVFQDYLYFPSYELAACLARLPSIDRTTVVLDGMSVAFDVVAAVAKIDSDDGLWRPESWTAQEIQAVWQQILEPLEPSARVLLAAGLPWHLYDAGHVAEAVKLIRDTAWVPTQHEQFARLAKSRIYTDYRPLFQAVGLTSAWDHELRARWRAGRRWLSQVFTSRSRSQRAA